MRTFAQNKVDLDLVSEANTSAIRQKIKICWPWSCSNFVRVDTVDIKNFLKILSFCRRDSLSTNFFPGSRSNPLRTFCLLVAYYRYQAQLTRMLLDRNGTHLIMPVACATGPNADQIWAVAESVHNQQTKGDNSARQTRYTKTKTWITYGNSTLHASKYKVRKLHERYILRLCTLYLLACRVELPQAIQVSIVCTLSVKRYYLPLLILPKILTLFRVLSLGLILFQITSQSTSRLSFY